MHAFHETMMGKKFIEHTVPEIGHQLKKIADNMKKTSESFEELKKQNEELFSILEYEEALTKDSGTAARIRKRLKELNRWT